GRLLEYVRPQVNQVSLTLMGSWGEDRLLNMVNRVAGDIREGLVQEVEQLTVEQIAINQEIDTLIESHKEAILYEDATGFRLVIEENGVIFNRLVGNKEFVRLALKIDDKVELKKLITDWLVDGEIIDKQLVESEKGEKLLEVLTLQMILLTPYKYSSLTILPKEVKEDKVKEIRVDPRKIVSKSILQIEIKTDSPWKLPINESIENTPSLVIKEQNYESIISGTTRVVYPHPTDPNKVIKINLQNGFISEDQMFSVISSRFEEHQVKLLMDQNLAELQIRELYRQKYGDELTDKVLPVIYEWGTVKYLVPGEDIERIYSFIVTDKTTSYQASGSSANDDEIYRDIVSKIQEPPGQVSEFFQQLPIELRGEELFKSLMSLVPISDPYLHNTGVTGDGRLVVNDFAMIDLDKLIEKVDKEIVDWDQLSRDELGKVVDKDDQRLLEQGEPLMNFEVLYSARFDPLIKILSKAKNPNQVNKYAFFGRPADYYEKILLGIVDLDALLEYANSLRTLFASKSAYAHIQEVITRLELYKQGKIVEAVEDNSELINISDVLVSEGYFQFKDKTDLMPADHWDEIAAGSILVWRDVKGEIGDSGLIYVVEGHHRLKLAQHLEISNVKVEFIQADLAREAKIIGLLHNIGEGKGTAIEAAKGLKDQGIDKTQLESVMKKYNLPEFLTSSSLIKKVVGLGSLTESLFKFSQSQKLSDIFVFSELSNRIQDELAKDLPGLVKHGFILINSDWMMKLIKNYGDEYYLNNKE
ncbi:hypothetical protein KKB06_00665, partial [Patescibacteria group bacterium]|nr:hypothetical protein [Patescibacteria group bacterium]